MHVWAGGRMGGWACGCMRVHARARARPSVRPSIRACTHTYDSFSRSPHLARAGEFGSNPMQVRWNHSCPNRCNDWPSLHHCQTSRHLYVYPWLPSSSPSPTPTLLAPPAFSPPLTDAAGSMQRAVGSWQQAAAVSGRQHVAAVDTPRILGGMRQASAAAVAVAAAAAAAAAAAVAVALKRGS